MRSSRALVQLRRGLLREQTCLPREVIRGLEAFVDTCKSEIRDVIEKAKAIQDRNTNLLGRDLWAVPEQPFLDVARQGLDGLIAHRPVLTGREHSSHELFAMERLALARSLYDEQHCAQEALEGRESKPTAQALTSTTHRIAVFDLS